mgnify:CR=1 FL=1
MAPPAGLKDDMTDMGGASPPNSGAKQATRRPRFGEWLSGSTRTANAFRLIISFVFAAVAWEITARYFITNRLILVPFTEVIQALVTDVTNGQLWVHTRITLLEIAIAFPISVIIGVAFGMLIASNRVIQQVLDPLLTAAYSVPIVALAPLFVAWLGFGIESKVAIILLVAVFPIVINTEVGLRSTDAGLIETARSFNATRWQVFRTVSLPFAIPFIIGGMRVAFTRTLVGVVVAEFFGAFAGFGYVILAASQTYATARLLGYVVLLALLGMVSSIALRAWEEHLAPWRKARES